jgi:hypothetical protein
VTGTRQLASVTSTPRLLAEKKWEKGTATAAGTAAILVDWTGAATAGVWALLVLARGRRHDSGIHVAALAGVALALTPRLRVSHPLSCRNGMMGPART